MPFISTRSSSSETDDEETKPFLTEDRAATPTIGRSCYNKTLWILTSLNILLFVTSTLLLTVWYYKQCPSLNHVLRQASTYSPILDLVDLESQVKAVNRSLFPPKAGGSIARQNPNPEADVVWEEWELLRVYPATKADIIRMGKDPSTVAKLEDETWGLGDDAYVTVLDVYHQLHCLNMPRKISYGEYYNQSIGHAENTTSMREVHINHCVDILMQMIQCSGNVNLITMHWTETQKLPWPDFSINRQCINFDKLTDWRIKNTVDMDKYFKTMRKPEGVKQHPQADAYYEHFHKGEPNPNHLNGANPDEDIIF